MTVVPFRRPESREAKSPPPSTRRSVAQFAVAMGMIGLVFYMLPGIWPTVPVHLLVVIHLLVAVVYFQQGPRVVSAVWMALTLVLLVMTGSPSPVTYAIAQGAAALDSAIPR